MRALVSLQNTSHALDVVVASEFDDLAAYNICEKYNIKRVDCIRSKAGPAYAWNMALKAAPNSDIYVLGSDDVEFMPGWLDEGLKVLQEQLNGSGLVAFNEGSRKVERTGFATQYMMTRDFIIEHNGGVAACPHYICDFTDVEASARAKKANKFAYANNAIVKHNWRVIDDDGYRRADTRRSEARAVFKEREKNGFPDDYERII